MKQMKQYFCYPGLCKKLQERGIKSQFNFWWEWSDFKRDYIFIGRKRKGEKVIRAYHWSDICMPENLKKIFGEQLNEMDMIKLTKEFYTVVQFPLLIGGIVEAQNWKEHVMDVLKNNPITNQQ